MTPDQDLLLCGGCQEVGYCDKLCCQKKAWKQGGHKGACAGMAAEAAAKAKAGEGTDTGGSGGGKKKKRNGKKEKGGRR